MEWLNYHHLFYFWTVVREGGVSRASKVLRLAQPTVSGQIKALENAFGEKLFQRQGRSLVLTDIGQVVFRYADEIFSLGRELQDTLKGRPVARPRRLLVGVSDSVEKRVAHRLLAPALELDEPVQLVVQEARPERLMAELAAHGLDLVLSDARPPPRCGPTAICSANAEWACSPVQRWPGSSPRGSRGRWRGRHCSPGRTAPRCSARWPTGSTAGASARESPGSSRTAR